MQRSLQGLVLGAFVIGLQDDLGEQFNGLREELAFEGEGELGDLSAHFHAEGPSEGVYQLVDFVFGVLGSAVECSLGHEVGD
jgi:hypothetical protein